MNKKVSLRNKYNHIALPIIVFILLAMLSGCANVGPKSISMGRLNYNEAINSTEDEQLLLSVVKGCYGETTSLLAVNGVAANIKFSSNAGIEAGFGPESNYTANLVPFSGGLVYEENPTITYTPVQSEKFLRQLMSPVPLDILVLFLRNEVDTTRTLTLLVKNINDMRNPAFLEDTSVSYDTRFQRFAELFSEFKKAGLIQLVTNPREDAPYDIMLSGYKQSDYSQKVNEFLDLIGFPIPMEGSKEILVPVYFGVIKSEVNGIAISTRSTYDLIEILKASVEIPKEHLNTGLTAAFPPMGAAGKDIRVHSSKDKPKQGIITVKYRGYWFFIDETDMPTKLYYKMARTLWSVVIAAAADDKGAPVLTLPISN